MSLPTISIAVPSPSPPPTSGTPPSTSADPSTSAPPPDPTDSSTNPPDSSTSGGGGSTGGSSGGSTGGTSSTGRPSSSSTTEDPTPTESSTETTLSESSTSVFESSSVITSDGQAYTTKVSVTTVIAPGTVITSPAKTNEDGGAPVGAIVGGVIGGIVALIAIGALIFFLLKRRRNNFDKEFDGNFDPDYVSKHGTGPTAFATGALGTAHRKSHSLEKGGRQRMNLNSGDRPSVEAALAEDDGMGGRLDASTVGGGIVMPFPYPQGQQGGAQSQGYGQAPYNPAMSPPPMSTHLPNSPPGGQTMALGAAAGAAGYYAGQQQQQQQQPYAYGQQPYGQGYPDRHGAISPSTTDGGYASSANPYLSGAASSSGHGHGGGGMNPYGGYVDPSVQSMYGGTAPSITGTTSTSGYGAFGGAAVALSDHSGSGPKSQTTGMSAKEREARGMRPHAGLGVVNPDNEQQLQPEPRREGSGGSVLPSPFDASGSSSAAGSPSAAGGGGAVGGKEAEANANRRQSQHGLIVHQDGGRVPDEEDTSPGEIPPAYDAILYEQRK